MHNTQDQKRGNKINISAEWTSSLIIVAGGETSGKSLLGHAMPCDYVGEKSKKGEEEKKKEKEKRAGVSKQRARFSGRGSFHVPFPRVLMHKTFGPSRDPFGNAGKQRRKQYSRAS